MGREKKNVGDIGEKIAATYLKRKGYRIMKRNFRTISGELDIVAKLKDIIVFVEVKTRVTTSFGPPYLSVTRVKQRHIIKSALFFLKCCRLAHAVWRVDIVSVKLDDKLNAEKIELIENAVEDPYV